MSILIIINLIILFISLIILFLALLISIKRNKDREKLTPFECGFDPFKKARIPFSIRFFLITVIFLIFDVEIALLLPLGLIKIFSNYIIINLTISLLIFILILGLFHE